MPTTTTSNLDLKKMTTDLKSEDIVAMLATPWTIRGTVPT